MVGLIFIFCLLFVLTGIGFLFAWLVSLASHPQHFEQSEADTPIPCPVREHVTLNKR